MDKRTSIRPADWPDVTVEQLEGQVVVTNTSITPPERLIFPCHLDRGDRAFTYASIDRPEPRHEMLVGEEWEKIGKIDPLVFHAWCLWLDDHHPRKATS